jgi:predicted nuclease of predicted toxin-antitoxin system
VIRFLTDENFNSHIISGVRRRLPEVDIVRVQDIGLDATDDRTILDFASGVGRVVLTHDVDTMVSFAYDSIVSGAPFAGIILVEAKAGLGQVIKDLSLLCLCSNDDELQGQVKYLPLK